MINKHVSSLWSGWLLALCGMVAFTGIMFAFAPQVLRPLMVRPFYNVFFDHDAFAVLTKPELTFQNWVYGAAGSNVVAWSLALSLIVVGPFRRSERWAWMVIAITIAAKTLINIYVALNYGVVRDALGNVGLLIAFGIPLAATYRQFQPSGRN